MATFTINESRVRLLAQIFEELHYIPDTFEDITPFKNDRYRELHFIFFLTAIDHNSHGAQRYDSILKGEIVHGSDLMYRLAGEAASRDADLFTASRLKSISDESVIGIFTTAEGKIPVGMPERAALLRDAAAVLSDQYGGDLRNLFAKGKGYLRHPEGNGILELLKSIRAYEDPLEKKSFLLIKMLRRKGLVLIKDQENVSAPVDHVLFTVALRSGIVVADGTTRDSILAKTVLSGDTVKELRKAALEAYKRVAAAGEVPVDTFDDLLWAYGRECLRLCAPFPREDIDRIQIPLNARIKDLDALQAFLLFINGLDNEAPEGASLYPVPVFPKTWYF